MQLHSVVREFCPSQFFPITDLMRLLHLILTLAIQTSHVLCEEPTTTSLYKELSVADSLLFSVGF